MLAQGNRRSELESRVKALDDRSARLEQELLQADDAITDALARGITLEESRRPGITIVPGRGNVGEDVATVMFVEALSFVLLGVVLFRRLRRRGPFAVARLAPEEAARLEQLQRSVDVIAVEVERISEGQRYVTKVLGDKLPAIGVGPEAR